MDKQQASHEGLVTIGDLSRMYDITKRTLRLYHEMDLLVPHYVDEYTGYRYYTRTQFARLEMILQMKSVGLSLNHIQQMLSARNLSLFEAILGEQMDKVDKKLDECRMYKESLARQLDGLKYLRNPPVFDSVFMEYIPRRAVLMYDIAPYDMEQDYPEGSPWKTALERVKERLVETGIPLTLFHQVSGMVDMKYLLQDRMMCSGAFIHLSGDHTFGPLQTVVESGTYVCNYHRYVAMDGYAESAGIRLMLQYIKDNDYQIAGPYLAHVVAEGYVFDYNDNHIVVKQQIPVANIS
ncbi:MAG: MerR family transcriptional regulator [Planctomycetaceae bacterium]|nr:MerR family transcriptional regulator [Planctomycetaceae bacterium]